MLTLCILILFAMYTGRTVKHLVNRLRTVDWQAKLASLWAYVEKYGKKAGRLAAKPLLQFYYVVTDSETTTLEKAMIYGCIAYVVMPFSILPRAVYKFIGIMDEAAAVLYVYNKIKDKITPEIELKVETTIDSWFGAEYTVIA
jgi:uncharacterized membrane protein YkvA (DUF1232 family)